MTPPREALPESVLCLHRVTRLPVGLGDPVFAHYSTMKLGEAASVAYYSRLLLPLVERAIADDPGHRDWVLTAPATDALPSGANLLCEAVDELLRGRLQPGVALRRVDLRQRTPDPAHRELNRAYKYSRLSWSARRRSRAYWHSLLIDEPALAGRAVIFVNDINVTGAQQAGMRDWFARQGAASVTWVYIVDVDEAVGRAAPEIEYTINESTPLTVELLAAVLASDGLRLTSKGVGRLLSLDERDLERLLTLLDEDGREELRRLAMIDSRYAARQYAAKMELLHQACAPAPPRRRQQPPLRGLQARK
ncbi:MAG TPA: phosphoribosyltransferase family protein [Thermoanaerobaculia bacterium]|nr:phosphoribosyltransferase family protein [Thermoanaerobaculia bacterium]